MRRRGLRNPVACGQMMMSSHADCFCSYCKQHLQHLLLNNKHHAMNFLGMTSCTMRQCPAVDIAAAKVRSKTDNDSNGCT